MQRLMWKQCIRLYSFAVDAIYCVPTAMHSIDHKFKYLLISFFPI